MDNLLRTLRGKKTYIISAVLIIVNGLIAGGVINPNQKETLIINAILGALGLGALRAGVAKAETRVV